LPPPALGQATKTLILEIRSAMGGEDAAVFAGELARVYLRYAERVHIKAELLEREALGAGWRFIVLRLSGRGVERLSGEAGTHRVTREPGNDRQGRRHTSAVTVAVLPVRATAEVLDLRDVRLDTFRASGHGGQHMQKTESAVRAVHIPTGLRAVIANERSQAHNKERALELLAARVAAKVGQAGQIHEDRLRRSQVGSGHISERSRTYAWKAGLVTDHRTGVSLPLADVLAGGLEPLLAAEQETE
jgi:peptide chain release factor 1